MTAETQRLEEAANRTARRRSDPSGTFDGRSSDRALRGVLPALDAPGPPGPGPEHGVLDAVGVAMYATDRDGRITSFNEAACELWGRRPTIGEACCTSLRLFFADGSPMPHDACPMAIALREGRPVRDAEVLLERDDGSRVWYRPYPTPVRDESGRLTGAVNVLIDLTELRRTEDALRTSAAELTASNAVKDEFLGLVSHELRTPITTVLGNAQLLHDKGEGLPHAVRSAMLGDIAAESERLLGIVENLLLLTRLESGHRLDAEPQVLAHVVRTTVEAFRHQHPGRVVHLQHEPRHLIVEADRPLLELLINNLLSNAHKYSPGEEPIEIVVGATNDETTVRVLDRGIGLGGIEPDRLFTPFYRSPQATATSSGIGIGLAACRRVAEALGGRIWAAPRDGGGAEFGFSLPLERAAGEPVPVLA